MLYKRNSAVAFYFVAREPWHDWSSSSSSASSTFLLLSCSKPNDQATFKLPVKPPPIHFRRWLPVQEQSLPSLGRFLHHSSEELATPESQQKVSFSRKFNTRLILRKKKMRNKMQEISPIQIANGILNILSIRQNLTLRHAVPKFLKHFSAQRSTINRQRDTCNSSISTLPLPSSSSHCIRSNYFIQPLSMWRCQLIAEQISLGEYLQE